MPVPDFTIIIPTRNGVQYLPYAIDSVLAQNEQGFELIVSDNHSTDGTADYLRSIRDPRVRCIKPANLLSMVDHFEFAIAAARGNWVTTLGDDDGLMPFFFQHLRMLRLERIKTRAVVFRRGYYFWDGCHELYGDEVVSYFPFLRQTYQNNFWSLFLCVCSVTDYMHLPQLYTSGLVRRDFIDRIRTRTGGRFFHGRAPDAASAVCLALNAHFHYRVEEPLFWTGTSPKSTGFSQSSLQNKARSLEFDDLNASMPVGTGLPAAVVSNSDLTILLYDILLQHPSAGSVWRSAMMRNFFFAGLVYKDRGNISLLEASFDDFDHSKVGRLIPIVERLSKRHLRKANMSNVTFSLHSKDRSQYPTMQDASAAAFRNWSQIKRSGPTTLGR